MPDNYSVIALNFVATCNDQTDGLVRLIETSALDPQDKKLIIDHMKRLQRGLAKATNAELEYMEHLSHRPTNL